MIKASVEFYHQDVFLLVNTNRNVVVERVASPCYRDSHVPGPETEVREVFESVCKRVAMGSRDNKVFEAERVVFDAPQKPFSSCFVLTLPFVDTNKSCVTRPVGSARNDAQCDGREPQLLILLHRFHQGYLQICHNQSQLQAKN